MPTDRLIRALLYVAGILNAALGVYELAQTHYRSAFSDHFIVSALAFLCLGYINELRKVKR
jgi:hypothetical membrane protein